MTYAVAIPAYNSERTVAETLESVLAQTVPPSDIVVVDDGSTDATADIVRAFGRGVRLVQQPNAGCGEATNRAIRETTTRIVATLDADDLWLPEKMERQLARLRQLDERALLFTRSRQFRHGDPDRSGGPERDAWNRSTLVMYRSAFDTIGPIQLPPVGGGDMVDWIGRAREKGFVTEILPEVLMLRRVIEGSMTNGGERDLNRGYLAVARAAILRRREAEKK